METITDKILNEKEDDVEIGYTKINGVKVKQTLVCCPNCGYIHIEMDATATFRLSLNHVWELLPYSQADLQEELDQNDNRCCCPSCDWDGVFSELVNFEPKKV